MLWDRGVWEPEGDPREGYAKGDLKFKLHGEKLKGSWVLARMKGRAGGDGGKNWLLIKKRDDAAISGSEPEPVSIDPASLPGADLRSNCVRKLS